MDHPSDPHVALPLSLLLRHIETDTDRVGVSEPLRGALVEAFRSTWDAAYEAGHRDAFEDDTVRTPVPTEIPPPLGR